MSVSAHEPRSPRHAAAGRIGRATQMAAATRPHHAPQAHRPGGRRHHHARRDRGRPERHRDPRLHRRRRPCRSSAARRPQLAGTIRLGDAAAPGVDGTPGARHATNTAATSTRSSPTGKVAFLNAATRASPNWQSSPPGARGRDRRRVVASLFGDFVAAGTADGRVVLLQVRFLPVHGDGAVARRHDRRPGARRRRARPWRPRRRAARRTSRRGDQKFVVGQVVGDATSRSGGPTTRARSTGKSCRSPTGRRSRRCASAAPARRSPAPTAARSTTGCSASRRR